jgi:hypothetical protein
MSPTIYDAQTKLFRFSQKLILRILDTYGQTPIELHNLYTINISVKEVWR